MSECRCGLRVKLVGDGCEVCNPSLAREMSDPIPAALREALDDPTSDKHPSGDRYRYGARCMAAALRWAHDENGFDPTCNMCLAIAALEQEAANGGQ